MRRALSAAALVSAFACVAALGLRTQTAVDLGYHLAYGEQFLETGRIVDHDGAVYTLPPADMPVAERPAPGPGCWYDEAGRYRFPNANWLSQVLMAAAWRMAGVKGLGALNLLLAAGTGALLLATMLRCGVPAPWDAGALLLFGLVSFSRFDLRPELFGDVVLALQTLLFLGIAAEVHRGAAPRWGSVAAVVATQIVFVNLHSYFPLGVLLGGTVLAEALFLRARPALVRLIVLQAGVVLACLVNPWGWRLALLPIQTLVYLRANGIGGTPGSHPWSRITEFRATLGFGLPGLWGCGFLLLLGLAVAGCVGAAVRRRPALLLMIGGMTVVALSMRRNVAAGAIVVLPASLLSCSLFAAARARPVNASRRGETPAAAVVLAAALAFAYGIASSRFYKEEGYPFRFGAGLSPIEVPLTAAAWLDRHLPGKRVWCDFRNSSNLHFFTRPHRQVPIVSNTWAYPPALMVENRGLRNAEQPFDPVAERLGVDAVLIRWQDSPGLALELAHDPRWAVVHIEGRNLLFVRATGDQEGLARRAAGLLQETPPSALIARYARMDPFLDEALLPAGESLAAAGLLDQSVAVLRYVTEKMPGDARAWTYLARAYAARAARRQPADEAGASEDRAEAARCLLRAGRFSHAAGDREPLSPELQ
jgi:hypothetical protein